MNLNFIDIFILFGSAQGFFLALLLLLKKDKRSINTPLIGYIFLLSLGLLNDFAFNTGAIIHAVNLAYIIEPFNMIYGLCIFLYVRNMVAQKFVWNKRDILMLLPFIGYLIYYCQFYFLGYDDKLSEVGCYLNEGIVYTENSIEWLVESVVNSSFLMATLFVLRKYHKDVKDNYSNIEAGEFRIVQAITVAILSIYVTEIIISSFALLGTVVPEIITYLIYGLLIILLFGVGYNELISSKTAVDIPQTKERYKNSALKSDSSKEIAERLKEYMQQHKPYRDPEISLKKLSEMFGSQSYIISQVINEVFECNFSEFVNSYRVEDAKLLLRNSDYKNYTLTAIGFEVGFNSKTSFYAAFKRFTGTTPAKY